MTSTQDVKVTLGQAGRHESVASMYKSGTLTSSLRADELFDSVDKNKSGSIDKTEFSSLHAVITQEAKDAASKQFATEQEAKEQRKQKKQMFKLAVALLVVVIISVGANAAMTAAVVFLSKESEVGSDGVMHVKGSSDPIKVGSTDTQISGASMAAAGSDDIVQVAAASQNIPLIVAPVLDHDQLATVTSLSVTLPAMDDFEVDPLTGISLAVTDEDEPLEMTRKYTITGYDWISPTRMHFTTTSGDKISIADGEAHMVPADGSPKLPVCAADATCSSFKVEGIDVKAKLLEVYGLDASEELLDPARRRLDTAGCGPCQEDSYSLCEQAKNDQTQPNWATLRLHRRKNCFVDGWCYFRTGDYFLCDRFSRGCEAPGSSDCMSFNRMVTSGQCPAKQEVGESAFCTTKFADRTEVGTCEGLTETACTAAYTVQRNHPYEDFPNNGFRLARDYKSNAGYQACEWSKGTCSRAKDATGEYEAITFCGDFCEIIATADETMENLQEEDKTTGIRRALKCNQGRLDQNPAEFPFGLPSRLSNRAACVASYFEVGLDSGTFQGCDWLGPTDPTNYYSSSHRCKPDFYCTEAAIAAGQCHPACNCMPKQGTACTPAQIMCCTGATCHVCAEIGAEVAGTTYTSFVL